MEKIDTSQIVHTINNINYILVEVPIFKGDGAKWQQRCKKFDCLVIAATLHKGGVFYNTYAQTKILVPEEKIVAFNNEVTYES